MERTEKAAKLFAMDGVNCCQAVVGTFDDAVGLPQETLLALGAAFGGGFCRRGDVCGAVAGLAMIVGLLKGKYDPSDKTAKENFYPVANEYIEAFEKKNGSLLCRELLENCEKPGLPTHHQYCEGLVCHAVELAEHLL